MEGNTGTLSAAHPHYSWPGGGGRLGVVDELRSMQFSLTDEMG